MALYRIPGLSIAVFDKHAIVGARTHGVREAGGPEPVTLETLFQAGSISKPVTALAVDASVPTLVQVLEGVAPANAAPVRVDIVPGTKTHYSGGGTSIVQLMMVAQLQKPFPQLMRETVRKPLGMTRSSYEQRPDRGPRRPTSRGSRSISSAKAGKSKRVLSQAMTKQMLTQQSEPFGLGFQVEPGTGQFRHGGSDEGFQDAFTAFSDTGSGVVVMANSATDSCSSTVSSPAWRRSLPGPGSSPSPRPRPPRWMCSCGSKASTPRSPGTPRSIARA
nr:serine hydrolase domain-containing protein [Corallococcus carmarthensis]